MHHVNVMRAIEVQITVSIDVRQRQRGGRGSTRESAVLHFGPPALSIIQEEPRSSRNSVDEQVQVAVPIHIRERSAGRELVRASRVADIHFFEPPVAQIAVESIPSLQSTKVDILPAVSVHI